jgi:hypothetical protein
MLKKPPVNLLGKIVVRSCASKLLQKALSRKILFTDRVYETAETKNCGTVRGSAGQGNG